SRARARVPGSIGVRRKVSLSRSSSSRHPETNRCGRPLQSAIPRRGPSYQSVTVWTISNTSGPSGCYLVPTGGAGGGKGAVQAGTGSGDHPADARARPRQNTGPARDRGFAQVIRGVEGEEGGS